MDRSPAPGGRESILQIRTASGSWLLPHSIASLCSLTSSRLRAMMWALALLSVHAGWVCSVLSCAGFAALLILQLFYFKSKLNVPSYSPCSDSLFRFASMTMWRCAVGCQLIPNYTGSSVGQRNQKLWPRSTTTCALSLNQIILSPKKALKHNFSQVSFNESFGAAVWQPVNDTPSQWCPPCFLRQRRVLEGKWRLSARVCQYVWELQLPVQEWLRAAREQARL